MKKLLACAALAGVFATNASAADLYQPEPIAQPPMEQPVVEQASGWYLRGDGSYDVNLLKGAHYFQGSNSLVNDFDSAKLRNSYNIGIGAGYQVNSYLRVDTTLDYMFSAKFRGSTSGTCGAGGTCVSTDVSAMAAYSLMANAYVDIGTFGLFTPYVGAGIGGTHVARDDLKNTACSKANPDACDDTVTHKGRESWRFTYALMAGTAIEINCNLKADVGYRYRHASGGDMFGYRLNGGPGYDKGLNIHEGRVGLRYNFGGCAEQAYLPPVDVPQQQPVFK